MNILHFLLLLTVHFVTVVSGFSLFGVRLFGDSGFNEDFAQANERFAIRLMQLLEREANGSKNVFISPFSIGLCMTMAMVGARGETYSQIHRTLGFSDFLSADDIAYGYHQLLPKIANNNVSVANAITLREGVTIGPDYRSNIQTNFNSTIFSVTSDAEATVNFINQWVSEKTNGMIRKLLSQSDLSSETVATLLNTIYFSAAWEDPFVDMDEQRFYYQPDRYSYVEFMEKMKKYKYAHFNDGQLIQLPYERINVSMFAFLPTKSYTSELSSQFVSSPTETLSSRISQLKWTQVELQMPKFKFECSYQLAEPLQQLGIVNAFMPGADFSRIASSLVLSNVVHKTVIEVDRKGTRAAGATASTFTLISAQPPLKATVVLNRPFVIFIRENTNGVVLFSGIINRLWTQGSTYVV